MKKCETLLFYLLVSENCGFSTDTAARVPQPNEWVVLGGGGCFGTYKKGVSSGHHCLNAFNHNVHISIKIKSAA